MAQEELQPEPSCDGVDLGDLCSRAAEMRNEILKIEAMLKLKKEAFSAVSDEILRTLELSDLDQVRAHGYLFYKKTKTSVTTPKTPQEKAALFDFLRGKGIFEEMVSIHSNTLNALYKSLSEEAAQQGNLDFRLPGVPEPTIYTTLELRKG